MTLGDIRRELRDLPDDMVVMVCTRLDSNLHEYRAVTKVGVKHLDGGGFVVVEVIRG